MSSCPFLLTMDQVFISINVKTPQMQAEIHVIECWYQVDVAIMLLLKVMTMQM